MVTYYDNIVTGPDVQQDTNPSKNEDYMTKDVIIENELSLKHSEKMEQVRDLLADVEDDPCKALDMVDALQKLCIDHHFRVEINSILKMLYARISEADVCNHGQSLYEVSNCLRILRQEGYYVRADVLGKFRRKDGRFMVEAADLKGLMALHEVSQLSIEGEYVLDEAADFSRNCLEKMMPFLDLDEATMMKNALERSYQRSSPTFMLKHFIECYAGTTMSELAELEMAKLRSMHRREVHQISRWWEDLGLAQELKVARNQPSKWYLWAMASLTDPSLSEQRFEVTKPIAFIFIIDDIFDVNGTLDELILFTKALNSWDANYSLEELPQHMRICAEALHGVTYEISEKIYKKYGFNPIEYLKQAWINLCEAFLVEARWFASEHLPMADDYLMNGIISSGTQVVMTHMFFLLGGGTSKETASIIDDNQGTVYCLAKLLRLWDDLSAKDENQEGHDGSYLTYYMKENEGCSLENAEEHVKAMISNTWKQLNKECLSPNPYSATFIKACLNLARMIPIMYPCDENHSLPLIKEYINFVF